MSEPAAPRVVLVKGGDDVLRGEAVSRLVDGFVAGRDRSLLVDEFLGPDFDLGAAVDAAQTPPFLTEDRIIVVRHLGRFSKTEDLTSLLTYLEAPLASTSLVLVWERPPSTSETGARSTARLPAVPPRLTKAITAAGGEVVSSDAPGGKGLEPWVAERLAAADLHADGSTRSMIAAHVGEDAGALVGLIELLGGVFGPGARLSRADVEPFLGQAGGVPPWELTDAIDRGDVAASLERLQRMTNAGRHPLVVMATLQNHFVRMTRLDGAAATSEKEAAALLGLKGSTFPAKKALSQARRLGPKGIRRSVELLAEADLDLRGARAWPEPLVIEVLVARLASLARASRR